MSAKSKTIDEITQSEVMETITNIEETFEDYTEKYDNAIPLDQEEYDIVDEVDF